MNIIRTSEDLIKPLFIARTHDAHKGSFGRAVIIGGSSNYIGAPLFAAQSASAIKAPQYNTIAGKERDFAIDAMNEPPDSDINSLSSESATDEALDDKKINNEFDSAKNLCANGQAAMISGCGLSTLAVPDFLFSSLYPYVRFSSLYKLSSDGESIIYNESEIDGLIKSASSFAVGMGAGDGETDKIIRRLLNLGTQNFVVDADALSKTADFDFCGRAVLTPHAGEAARLMGSSVSDIIAHAPELCMEYAKKHGCVILLKSSVSYISDGKEVYKNETGNVKLAKGGSGDVLSGIIAGLLAWGNSPLNAAIAGAYILGKCAEVSPVNDYSNLPVDTIAQIPLLLSKLM